MTACFQPASLIKHIHARIYGSVRFIKFTSPPRHGGQVHLVEEVCLTLPASDQASYREGVSLVPAQ